MHITLFYLCNNFALVTITTFARIQDAPILTQLVLEYMVESQNQD